MAKRKKTKNFDGRLIAFRSKLLTGRDPGAAVSELKGRYQSAEIKKYVPEIWKIPQYRSYLFAAPFPSVLTQLKNSRLLVMTNLEREILWNSVLLRLFATEINTFLDIKRRFDACLMLGEYHSAVEILDLVEEKFGWSVWLIENRITVLQMHEGLDKQKAYSEEVVKNENLSWWIRSFAHFFSVRTEPNMSCERYNSLISNFVNRNDLGRLHAASYFVYKLNPFNVASSRDLAEILIRESDSAVVDRYLTLIRVCQRIACRPPIGSWHESIEVAMRLLVGKILDPSLESLACQLGIAFPKEADTAFQKTIRAMDRYTSGEYKECAQLCEEIISDAPCDIDVLETYSKSLIRLRSALPIVKKDTLVAAIIAGMMDILAKTTTAHDTYLELLKIAYTFSNQSWSAKLVAFIRKEFFHFDTRKPDENVVLGQILTHSHNPKLGMMIRDSNMQAQFYSSIQLEYPESKTVKLYNILSHAANDVEALLRLELPIGRYLKYSAEIMGKTGDTARQSETYRKLINLDDMLFYQDGVVGLIKCNIESGNLGECLDTIVDAYLRNRNLFGKLPVAEVLDLVGHHYSEGLAGNISLPIVYDIYSKHFSLDKEILKCQTYEEFLNHRGFNRPSQLAEHISEFETSKLIYYLRHVCLPQVMDSSVAFDSSEDVENERIRVLQILVAIDKENSDIYSNEIKDITQRLLISKEIQAIEQSKIFVEVDGIRKSIDKDLRESYKRYVSLPSPVLSDDIIIKVREAVGPDVQILTLPGNEKNDLFTEIFLELRDKFVSSNEYGLDGYLSVRVRHGTLSGQLRGPLEAAKLITLKDNETQTYQDNDYWAKRYTYVEDQIRNKIIRRLNSFSEEIDGLIDILKNKWIQIKTEDRNPDGLFDFTFTKLELYQMQSRLMPTTTYEEFLDMAIGELWTVTDVSLENIRRGVSTTLKSNFNRAFDELLRDISTLKNGYNVEELESSIARSRTVVQDELDKIAFWFTRSQPSESRDFDIELPVRIGITMINNAYPGRRIEPTLQMEHCSLKGWALKGMVDIVYIMLDNIVKHSGVTQHIPQVIVVSHREGKRLRISVKNEVVLGASIDHCNERLQEIKHSLAVAKSIDSVRKEGGTGFYKIQKILSFDLKCKHGMDFLFRDENEFTVDIAIDGEGMLI